MSMRLKVKRTAAGFGALLLCLTATHAAAQATAATAPTTTILFVRHAEAGRDDPRDPTLSEAGQKRAQDLAARLKDAGLAAVYSSQYKRTRLTGEAVATAAGLKVEVVPVSGATLAADAASLVARLAKEHPGRTVLVVGHSNTVPLMVAAATGGTPDTIAETEYDRLYVVTVTAGKGTVVRAKY